MLKCYYANMLTCQETWLKDYAGIAAFMNKRSAFILETVSLNSQYNIVFQTDVVKKPVERCVVRLQIAVYRRSHCVDFLFLNKLKAQLRQTNKNTNFSRNKQNKYIFITTQVAVGRGGEGGGATSLITPRPSTPIRPHHLFV